MQYELFDYHIIHFREENDPDYGVFIEEIPDVSAFGSTPEEALQELRIAFKGWHEIMESKGWPIPVPFKHRKYSGRFNVRISPAVHQALSELAEKDDVSLNLEVAHGLTAWVERRTQCKRSA